MEVGTSNFGSRKKYFKIKDGDNVYRILPPLGNMASTGRFFKYYRLEWGYKGSDNRNKPFQDCRKVDYETKEVLVESAAYGRRIEIANAKDQVTEALKTDPTNATLIEKKKKLIELSRQYNLEAKYYLNAVNEQGEIGLLKIGKRAIDGLRGQITSIMEKGASDPTSLSGLYFNFHRSGTGLDTVYTVTPYSENVQIDGQTLQKVKSHLMDENFIKRLDTEAFELGDMYPAPTAEEVARIVTEGVTAVDEILGKKEEENKNTAAAAAQAEAVQQPVAEPAPTPAVETNVDTVLNNTPSEPVVTPPATETTPAAVATNEAPAPGSDVSDEEFLKRLGV